MRGIEKLDGVNIRLSNVVSLAMKRLDGFVVHEGLRSIERQRRLVADGRSWTMNSKHITGRAVDLWCVVSGGKVTWDWSRYKELAKVMKACAKELGVKIEWGGDWKKKDGPHFQLADEKGA